MIKSCRKESCEYKISSSNTFNEYIKTQLENQGIRINLIQANQEQYNNYLSTKNYDMILCTMTLSLSPNLTTFFGANNLANYANEEVNNILFAKVEADSEDLNDGDPYYFYKASGAISSVVVSWNVIGGDFDGRIPNMQARKKFQLYGKQSEVWIYRQCRSRKKSLRFRRDETSSIIRRQLEFPWL